MWASALEPRDESGRLVGVVGGIGSLPRPLSAEPRRWGRVMGVGVFAVIGSPSPSPSPSLSAALEPRYEIGRSMRVGLSWLLLIREGGAWIRGVTIRGAGLFLVVFSKFRCCGTLFVRVFFFGGGSESVAQRDDR